MNTKENLITAVIYQLESDAAVFDTSCLRGLLERISNTDLVNCLPDDNRDEFIHLKIEDGNKISLIWSIEDILGYAANEMDGVELTEEDARCILSDIDSNWDASIGVSWDTIESYINMHLDYLKEEEEKEKEEQNENV